MWLIVGLLDATVWWQHTGQRCPTEAMFVRSIRGEQPIKVLLRFTQQLKPNRRSQPSGLLECMYKHWLAQQHTCFSIPSFHSHALQARKGQTLRLWRQSRDRWWWRASFRQQDTSTSSLSSPYLLASPLYIGKESGLLIHAGTNGLGKREGETERKRGGPKMALNVWKSTLPILAVKLKRQQAQTHESECDRIVEFRMAGTGSNQTNT